MSASTESIAVLFLSISAILLAAGIIFTVIRLIQGPTLPDAAVCLDVLGIEGIGVLTLYAIWKQEDYLVDVAIVLALVSFISTLAFARYIFRGGG